MNLLAKYFFLVVGVVAAGMAMVNNNIGGWHCSCRRLYIICDDGNRRI